MAQFNKMSITNKGKVLYAKAQAGAELHFTKMMIGSGTVGSQNPETLLALIDPKYDVGIQSKSVNTEAKTATISGMINNSSVTEGTYICEIGLFAQDPDDGEVLYAYGSAGNFGDYMAPATSGAYSWNYEIIAAVGNAANITVELSNLVYDHRVINTNTTFNIISGGNQKEINKSIDAHINVLTNDNIPFATTTGSANNYIATLNPALTVYKNGFGICIKINADSTAASTLNINGLGAKAIKKANGNNVTNLKTEGIYTLRYNSTTGNFILQGEGGSGNATASDIYPGRTASTDAGDVVGNMALLGEQIITPTTHDQTIAAGRYLTGKQVILGDQDLTEDNIISAANIFGVQGKATVESLGGLKGKSGTAICEANGSSAKVTIDGLNFTPKLLVITAGSMVGITMDFVGQGMWTIWSSVGSPGQRVSGSSCGVIDVRYGSITVGNWGGAGLVVNYTVL